MDSASDVVVQAALENADDIVKLSTAVQDALTASGSLQIIEPLTLDTVREHISDGRCYIIQDASGLVACALARPMTADFIHQESRGKALDIAMHVEPWLYLHSVMLRPDMQGRGLGDVFVAGVVHQIAKKLTKGTLFLAFWAGNEKLRAFYTRTGFHLAQDVPMEGYSVALFYKHLEDVFRVAESRPSS